MIIKKRKQQDPQPPSGQPGGNALPETEVETPERKPEKPKPEYTSEAIEAGKVPERREGERNDRRRTYRRIEDKQLISKAHEEANAIRESAYQEGLEQGMAAAAEQMDALRGVMADLLAVREEALMSAADDISAIAVEMAERIIKIEISCDETLINAIVRDTIQKADRKSKTILVKVHPDDVPMVKQDLKQDPLPNVQAEIVVMEDATIDRGSCIIETGSGMIDASFSTQLEILRHLFGKIDSGVDTGVSAQPDYPADMNVDLDQAGEGG